MGLKILDEIICFSKLAEKEHSRGGSFRPFKYYRYIEGKNIPTFFIGSPGVYVAISTTIIVVLTVVLISLKFNVWWWLIYFLVSGFMTRLAMKMDKAKQIRGLSYAVTKQALDFMNEYNKTGNTRMLENALELLKKAQEWVDERVFENQIKIINDVIQKKPS